MSDSFFDYIKKNITFPSQGLFPKEETYKKYWRLTPIPLTTAGEEFYDVKKLLTQRKTNRDFSDQSLSKNILGSILNNSFGRNEASEGLKKRPFPSGGGLYPTECYLLVNNVSEVESGVYHYQIEEQAIVKINSTSLSLQDLNTILYGSFSTMPQVVCLITYQKNRNVFKYGTLGYSLALIEAGHIGQNLYLLAAANGVGCCGLGLAEYDQLHALLEIDGNQEHFLYGVALGYVK